MKKKVVYIIIAVVLILIVSLLVFFNLNYNKNDKYELVINGSYLYSHKINEVNNEVFNKILVDGASNGSLTYSIGQISPSLIGKVNCSDSEKPPIILGVNGSRVPTYILDCNKGEFWVTEETSQGWTLYNTFYN